MRNRIMRLTTAVGAISVLGALMAAPALAVEPAHTCPAAASGFERVDRDGWWDVTVQGFAEEGISVYEWDGETYSDQFEAFAVAFGFASAAEAEFWVRYVQWAGIDRNQNDYACIKDLPNTPSRPGFVFNGTDDRASVPGS